MEVKQDKTTSLSADKDEQFWLHRNVAYSSRIDEHRNYFFELVNYQTSKIYREYLSLVQVSAVELDNAHCFFHPHLHK